MSNYCVVVNFSTIVLYKKQGLKWIFLPIKFWLVRSTSSLPPPYHASSSSFVFSFTRFFFSSFPFHFCCFLLREPGAAPSVASICTSCSSLLLPLLHLRAAAAAAEAAAKTGRQRQQQELVGPPLFPARSRWFQAPNLKLVTWAFLFQSNST